MFFCCSFQLNIEEPAKHSLINNETLEKHRTIRLFRSKSKRVLRTTRQRRVSSEQNTQRVLRACPFFIQVHAPTLLARGFSFSPGR